MWKKLKKKKNWKKKFEKNWKKWKKNFFFHFFKKFLSNSFGHRFANFYRIWALVGSKFQIFIIDSKKSKEKIIVCLFPMKKSKSSFWFIFLAYLKKSSCKFGSKPEKSYQFFHFWKIQIISEFSSLLASKSDKNSLFYDQFCTRYFSRYYSCSAEQHCSLQCLAAVQEAFKAELFYFVWKNH